MQEEIQDKLIEILKTPGLTIHPVPKRRPSGLTEFRVDGTGLKMVTEWEIVRWVELKYHTFSGPDVIKAAQDLYDCWKACQDYEKNREICEDLDNILLAIRRQRDMGSQ